MSGSFAKAVREKLRLRMAIDGPSGSGKSITALRCALALSPSKKIAVIDTEHGSARKYIGEDFGEGSIDFEVCELKSYSPSNYTSLINEASRGGFDVVIVDSLSHAWEGKDGALELVNKKGGNSFTAWKDVTPMHQAMVQAILDAGCHVIVTMRSKTEYVMEADSNGKQIPRKVGMAPVQRQGMEYEFDVYLSMDWSHIGSVTKSRCRAVDGLIVAKPGADFMRPIIEWLEHGETAKAPVPAAGISQDQLEELAGLLSTLGIKQAVIEKTLPKKFGIRKIGELNFQQAASVISMLRVDVESKAKRDAAAAEQTAAEETTETSPSDVAVAPAKANLPMATQSQISRLKWIGNGSGKIPADRWADILAKRDAKTEGDLTFAQAEELIANLEKKWPDIANTTGPASVASDVPFLTADPDDADPSNAAVSGKATKEQVEDMIRYRDQLGISLVQWSAILSKKNVAYEGELSRHDADTFLVNLEKKLQQKTVSAGLKEFGETAAPDATPHPSHAVSTKN